MNPELLAHIIPVVSAAETQLPAAPATPFYVYDMPLLRKTVEAAKQAAAYSFPLRSVRLHYAMKANNETPVMEVMAAEGLGIDAVSIEEVELAVKLGFKPDNIVFAGVGKSEYDIYTAATAGVGMFNVESVEELNSVSRISAVIGRDINVSLRINPDIDPHTHRFITTGLEENKFGIPLAQLDLAVNRALSLPGIVLAGLHFHIGSQIEDCSIFTRLAEIASDTVKALVANGISIANLNLGGGFGVDYHHPDEANMPDFKAWFDSIAKGLDVPQNVTLHFEPGRSVVAQCGSLITRVIRVKHGPTKNFAILDAGFNILLRPAFYQAYHHFENLTHKDAAVIPDAEKYDIVGPLCESSDVFCHDITMPRLADGDILAVRSAGAYGSSMASGYNLRTVRPSVFIEY